MHAYRGLVHTNTVSLLVSLSLTPNPPAPQGLKFMCEINRERETDGERTHGVTQEAGEGKREEKGGGEKEAGRQLYVRTIEGKKSKKWKKKHDI